MDTVRFLMGTKVFLCGPFIHLLLYRLGVLLEDPLWLDSGEDGVENFFFSIDARKS
ncbi:hypothetical protein BDV27DRAFT_130310 [Aspergillus caelatus]|uniref:Uncharacterized protein n=1 Tax=Aspergillus caelatus TaxID=61420 RepID=A0A5N7A0K2_9EURO|nr:uncharacterized protein BDV27DRAFT_130310 [Aspergillus caelatus]KAE8363215.1 hypothetical protein BDV27DRAFT_130310 [Aspergillus caelatus]